MTWNLDFPRSALYRRYYFSLSQSSCVFWLIEAQKTEFNFNQCKDETIKKQCKKKIDELMTQQFLIKDKANARNKKQQGDAKKVSS